MSCSRLVGHRLEKESLTRRPQKEKRKYVEVEMSAGSGDPPQRCRMRVPFTGRGLNLQLNIQMEEENGSNSSETVPASPPDTVGAMLPLPAPGQLGSSGVSMVDLWNLQAKWTRGEITRAQLERDHGEGGAAAMIATWTDEAREAYETSPQTSQRRERKEITDKEQKKTDGEQKEDDDENAMLSLQFVVAATAGFITTGMEANQPMMSLLREHLSRQQGQGMTQREQASTLYYMVQNRGCEEYMNMFPELG